MSNSILDDHVEKAARRQVPRLGYPTKPVVLQLNVIQVSGADLNRPQDVLVVMWLVNPGS